MSRHLLLPGSPDGKPATLGVLGGGQLGRMFAQAAQSMGYGTVVLDPDANSPAGFADHQHIQSAYLDQSALAQLIASSSVVTTEFENVPAAALLASALQRPTAPSAQAVAITQDRIQEKAHLALSGVPVAPYAVIENAADLQKIAVGLLPGILKTARFGYDGKGQIHVASQAQLASAWNALGQVPCVLEQALKLEAECSVIVARGWDGVCVNFAPQRNVHEGGILLRTEAYANNLPAAVAQQAIAASWAIAHELNYVGVLCVEFFLLDAASPEFASLGQLVVNEMAPRPHNSGHYTIDACDVSQFDLQVRVLTGLPLLPPRQHSAAVMLNLLGDLWADGRQPRWDAVLGLPGAHLHLYGKLQAKPGRKMGHLTLTAASADAAMQHARQAAALLGMTAF